MVFCDNYCIIFLFLWFSHLLLLDTKQLLSDADHVGCTSKLNSLDVFSMYCITSIISFT